MNLTNDKTKWLALVAGYLLYFSTALMFFAVPPLIDEIRGDISMNDVDYGWMQGIYAFPAVILALAAGLFLDKFDSKKTGVVAGLLLLAGNILFNVGSNYFLMLFGRFLVGVATIILNLVAAKMFTIWFPPRQRGLAMSVLHTAWPLTSLVAFTTFVSLGSEFGWQMVVAGVNVFSFLTVIIFIFMAPGDPEKALDPDVSSAANPLKRILQLPGQVWLAAVSWFFFTSCMILMISFGASFLAQGGIDFAHANVAVSFLMGAAGLITPFAGYVIDRFGSLKSYIVFPPLIVAVCFGLFVFRQEPAILLALAGAAVAFTPTAIYAVPGMEVSPAKVGLAFGLILTFSNFGNTISPVIGGWLNEIFKTSGASILLSVFSIICCSTIAMFLKKYKTSDYH